MELVEFAKETLHNAAEQAASYRLGQSVLRYMDRGLWVIEKCARWAVPPPVEQDGRPQPELVRPLAWPFFLWMLVTLRLTRESLSLINMILGKPPLRSADVVCYIQSKRRYLRTLKYLGNRAMRARAAQPRSSWLQAIQSSLGVALCFRRPQDYGNNNTQLTSNEEVLVVKRNRRGREKNSPIGSSGENSMDRLIEKMMVDLDAESEDDDSYTLTNATSLRSDRSEVSSGSYEDLPPVRASTPSKSETTLTPDSVLNKTLSTDSNHGSTTIKEPDDVEPRKSDVQIINDKRLPVTEPDSKLDQTNESQQKITQLSEIETKTEESKTEIKTKEPYDQFIDKNETENVMPASIDVAEENKSAINIEESNNKNAIEKVEENRTEVDNAVAKLETKDSHKSPETKQTSNSAKEETKQSQRTPSKEEDVVKKPQKIVNGRTIKNTTNKKKGSRTDKKEDPAVKVNPADSPVHLKKGNKQRQQTDL